MATPGTIPVTVMTPSEVVWQGAVQEVASTNSEGPFSILPDHANFITILNNTPLQLYLSDDSQKTFRYAEAVLVVRDGVVSVYVHEAPSE